MLNFPILYCSPLYCTALFLCPRPVPVTWRQIVIVSRLECIFCTVHCKYTRGLRIQHTYGRISWRVRIEVAIKINPLFFFFVCHVSHVTYNMSLTTTSTTTDPPPGNSPTMYSRLVWKDRIVVLRNQHIYQKKSKIRREKNIVKKSFLPSNK